MNLSRSLATVTALVPRLGYDRAGEVAREAQASGRTVRQTVLDLGLLTASELDRLLSAEAMTALGFCE